MGDFPRPGPVEFDPPGPPLIAPEPDGEERWTPAMRAAREALKDPSLPEDKRTEILELLDVAAGQNGVLLNVPARTGQPADGTDGPSAPRPPPPKKSLEEIAGSDVVGGFSGLADGSQGPPLPQLPPQIGEGLFGHYVYEPARRPGESTEMHQARGDANWYQRYKEAEREGGTLRRQNATTGLDRFTSSLQGYLAAPIVGLSQGLLSGLPEQPLRWVPGGEQALQDMRDAAHSEFDVGADINEAVRGGTELLSALHPRSLANRVTGGVMGRLGGLDEAAGAVRRTVSAAASGGVDSLMRSAIESGGKLVSGVEQGVDDLKDAGVNALESMAMSGFLAPVMEMAQAFGFNRVNALRQAPNVGSKIGNVEAADGKTTWRRTAGLVPPQEVLEAQALQSLPRPKIGQSVDPSIERGMPAQDISVNRAVDTLHKDLETHRGGVRKRIGTEESSYLNEPEGAVPLSVDSVIARLQRRIAAGTGSDGQTLPGYALEADQKLLAEFQRGEYVEPGGDPRSGERISVEDARARGLAFDETDIGKIAAARVGQQELLMNPQSRSASDQARGVRIVDEPKPDAAGEGGPVYKTVDELVEGGSRINTEPMYQRHMRELEKGGEVSVENRQFTPREIEGIIDRYQARLKRGNLRHEDVTAETELLPELYELRRQYGFNSAAPSPAGGYHAMKERHHGEMNKLEQLYEAVGENPRMDVVDPTSKIQRQPLENFVRNLRKEGAPAHEKFPALVEFVAARPELARKLDVAIANRDYDALRSGMEEPLRGLAQLGIPGKVGARLGLTERILKFLRLSIDPAMQDLAGTQRGGRVPDSMPPTIGDFRPAPDFFNQTQTPRDTVPQALGSSRGARAASAIADDRDLSEDALWLKRAVERMWAE